MKDMDASFIATFFEHLPRQGPGSSACTKKMFSRIRGLPPSPRILDIGCGSGMQTVDLAGCDPAARIVALDFHVPFLSDLCLRAKRDRVADRVEVVQASMDKLPFAHESFDLIWAEGSIFVIGLEEGIASWKKFIRPNGFLAFTEAVWFTNTPSVEARAFWDEQYPAIRTVERIQACAEGLGYSWITSFPLPASAWWDDYYTPLLARLPLLEKTYAGNREADGLIAFIKQEIDLHRAHSGEYGYQFILLKNNM
jgi:ubiquinone/menaquinone biosynthesis C-methylase UbiE